MEATYVFDSEDQNGEALLAPLSHAAISRLKAVPRLQDNPYIICGRKAGQHLVNLKDAWIESERPQDSTIYASMIYGARSALGS